MFGTRFWVSLALTVPILLLSDAFMRFVGLGGAVRFPGGTALLFGLSTVVFAYGGWPFLTGMAREVRERAIGMMTLISVAITSAYSYSAAVTFGLEGMPFYWELATLIDVMLLGHWIEMRSVAGASRALEALARLLPADAHRVEADGRSVEVPIAQLKIGDKVIVKPGEKVPADGIIIDGLTTVDESLLTGESTPTVKGVGAEVIGGSLNGEGSVTVEVRAAGAGSFVSRVIDLVREAQGSKSRAQLLADRAAAWLTAVALGGGAITFLVWLGLGPATPRIAPVGFGRVAYALERAVTVMVTACPHALGLAVPLVVAISTALAASRGLIIRDRAAFERARAVDTVVFDKTGTLTEGRFGVTGVLVIDQGAQARTAEEILALAASVEARSEHPIAKAISAATPHVMPVTDFTATPGKGAEATVDGSRVAVVSRAHAKELGLASDDPRLVALEERGATVVVVAVDGLSAGAVALTDIIRPESREAVATLKAMRVRAMMLTGDAERVAADVARRIGISEYRAQVLPDQKAEAIREIQQGGAVVGMAGDGVNDAPALALADLGMAIGAGTDVAVETADVILVKNDPRDVPAVIELSRATYRKMVQNLWWAAGYNVFALPLAAGVFAPWGLVVSPAFGAALMALSTVIVAMNARLLRGPRRA